MGGEVLASMQVKTSVLQFAAHELVLGKTFCYSFWKCCYFF